MAMRDFERAEVLLPWLQYLRRIDGPIIVEVRKREMDL